MNIWIIFNYTCESIILGFIPYSPMIVGQEKFGIPEKRTRPRENALEQKAWDHFKGCVESEIQIILNVCQCK